MQSEKLRASLAVSNALPASALSEEHTQLVPVLRMAIIDERFFFIDV